MVEENKSVKQQDTAQLIFMWKGSDCFFLKKKQKTQKPLLFF